MVLCDTNILIEFFKKNVKTKELLSGIGNQHISISSITLMELLVGARDKQELQKIYKTIQNTSLLHITENISLLSVELINEYTKSHGLLIPDALIAATAIINKIPLLTYNIKDFKFIRNLELYNL
ncbi:MAG: type II toxin-antitoxin system VapC family toxin [Spirochaetales bacterium]|nr:type II toxin-antitoxin system VapC family toxin [Spirochaetales bacterium]